jgi:hypothetical protein
MEVAGRSMITCSAGRVSGTTDDGTKEASRCLACIEDWTTCRLLGGSSDGSLGSTNRTLETDPAHDPSLM